MFRIGYVLATLGLAGLAEAAHLHDPASSTVGIPAVILAVAGIAAIAIGTAFPDA